MLQVQIEEERAHLLLKTQDEGSLVHVQSLFVGIDEGIVSQMSWSQDPFHIKTIKKPKQTSQHKKKGNRLTDIENKLVVTSGERDGEEGQYRGRRLRGTNYYA